jgi:hypothetical protein
MMSATSMLNRLALTLSFLVLFSSAGRALAAGGFVSAPATVQVLCGANTIAVPVTWYFPVAQPAPGLVWLQHGFFRTKENVADLASEFARAGFVVVTPTIASLQPSCTFNDVTGFVPNLATLFGSLNDEGSALLASARAAAAGLGVQVAALPTRFVFSGHSAGGSAVTLAAKEFITRFPSEASRLRGLVLLDPVENFAGSMTTSLPSLWNVPILTVSAPPGACNADTSGTNALLGLGRPFVGFEVTTGSHCDAEGASGNPVLCGLICGAVQPLNVVVLKIFAVGWTADLLFGRPTYSLYPGGPFYNAVAAAGFVRTY